MVTVTPNRTDALTPELPREAQEKLSVLRVEIVNAFMEGDYLRWDRLVQEATLILRLAGIEPPDDLRRKAMLTHTRKRKRN